MKKLTIYGLGAAASLLAITGCEEDNGAGNGDVVKEWTIALSGELEVPSTNRTETGTAHLVLYTNNELEYEIRVDELASGDELTMAHVHTGDPVTSGPVAITIVDGDTRSFSGTTAVGSVALTQENVDLMMGDSIYFNVHSAQAPAGLIRGQIDQEIVFADDIRLESDNEVPPVAVNEASASAHIRLTADNILFYKVKDVEVAVPDPITAGHIHKGAAGTNGEVEIDLAFEQDDVNTTKKLTLNAGQVDLLNNEDTYLNLHSTLAPDGLMRGQIDR
ncbi:CHRD domain-containing protein [Anseongella ginsenosidimutans]|uniref:CHRD domain-containing protein n=1 Tax=Anseongella ginsenosidimutans TaxID=496056 RepID=A0A4R3KPZ9_9SPHI|nr:CHRD domain-containing protein [Anseongella ginsenosidimutans]TCS86816.1 CHRD domain-containing protein [Anseongella ginsenosidimutans]